MALLIFVIIYCCILTGTVVLFFDFVSQDKLSGDLIVSQDEDGAYFSLQLNVDPKIIMEKDEVTFKVRNINSSYNGAMILNKTKGEQNG